MRTRLPAYARLGEIAGVGAISIIEVAMAVSFAALVFPVDTVGALPRLMGAFVVGSALSCAIVAWKLSIPGGVTTTQDAPLIVVAAMIATVLPRVPDDQQFATALALVAVSAVVTGIGMVLLGHFGLGNLVRYLPSPVIGGYRLGSGVLLVVGGIEVTASRRLDWDLVANDLDWSLIKLLLPALGLALVVLWPTIRNVSPVLVANLIVFSAAVFYAAVAMWSSVDAVEAGGWLLGPFENDARWVPLLGDLADVDWLVVAGQGAGIGAVALVTVIGLLLNLAALETELDVEADFDHDLQVGGVANVAAGLIGGGPTYTMLSGTVLADRVGARSRRAVGSVSLVLLAALVVGSSYAGMTPRFLAGGVLGGLGIDFIFSWVREQRRHRVIDATTGLAVAAAIAFVGIIEGIAVGLLLAAAIFVFRYSRLDPVRRVRSGAGVVSRVDRSTATLEALRASQQGLLVVELEGFIFFGSMVRVREALTEARDSGATQVVLDFGRVTGIDVSAREQFTRLFEQMDAAGVTLRLSGRPARTLRRIAPTGGIAADLDQAVELAEEAMLVALDFGDDVSASGPLAELLTDLPLEALAAGTDLFRTGDPAGAFYMVESGGVSVWLDGDDDPVRVRRVGAGALLGELGYITGRPRSARATADVDTVLRRVEPALVTGLDSDRAARINTELLRQLAGRLEATNQALRESSR